MRILKKQQLSRSTFRRKNCDRRGTTSVEFAIVAPLVLLVVFGLFEMSRAMTISDSVRTAVIAGAREAGIAQTTADNVEDEMRRVLNLFRVRNPTIVVTPEIIDESVGEVSISIRVPMDTSNGVVMHRVVGAEAMALDRTIPR